MSVKVLIVAIVFVLAGCGGRAAKPQRVPDLRGERLDVAEARLRDRGLDWEELGGGALGILVRSNWDVCDQEPAAGVRATKVRLIVERDCYDDDWDD